VNTASKESVNCPARSRIRDLDAVGALAEVHEEVTRCLSCPRAVRVCGDAAQVSAAGAVLDDDQRVQAPQEHGIHVHEAGGDDAASLGGEELLPCRARPAGRGIDPGVVQDLPDGGSRDLVAELAELALYPPVAPGRVLRRHAYHEPADRGCGGRPSRTPPVRVVPFTCDQPPVPGKQRRRGHGEHVAPAVPRDQPGQRGKPQPAGWLVADLGDLAAEHCVLMPEDQ